MYVGILEGGDAQMVKSVFTDLPNVDRAKFKEILALFPKAKPLKIDPAQENVPELVCCACQEKPLLHRSKWEEMLFLTHIYSGMRVDECYVDDQRNYNGIYLLCGGCLAAIKTIVET